MKTTIAVSRCLLGDKVRYDGTAKCCEKLFELNRKQYEIIPYCPELAIGLSVPRLPMRLDKVNGVIFARQIKDNRIDYTGQLKDYARKFLEENQGLSIVITKKGSPSCGYKSSKLYEDSLLLEHKVSGIFIAEIERLKPDLLIIDEHEFVNNEIFPECFSEQQKRPG